MIAYNTNWLSNRLVREEVTAANEAGQISQEEKDRIFNAYPSAFYTPNPFVRIGLFLLTIIIALFSLGLFLLLFASSSDSQLGSLVVFFGLVLYAALEIIVRKNHYRSGVDDALLWASPATILGGLNLFANLSLQDNCMIIFTLSLFLFLRFTDRLMAITANLSLLATLFLAVIKTGTASSLLSPFIMMISSAALYFFAQSGSKKLNWINYRNGLSLVTVTSLVTLYLAGNYYVVSELGRYMGINNSNSGQSNSSWMFWLWTFILPVLYITRGIKNKDRVFLRLGLALVALAVLTFRYYYALLTLEKAAVLAGIILITGAYTLIQYLKEPKFGFTSKPGDDYPAPGKQNIEALVLAQSFATPVSGATDNTMSFGGGSGGGGGATGEY